MTRSRRACWGLALHRAATVLILVTGLGAVHLGTSSAALAHDGLLGTTPVAGSTVPEGPDTVELDFTAEPLPIGTLVAVTAPDGASVSSGGAEIRGTTVVQPLAGTGSAGTYRVEWRSSSSDGHALSGAFDFTVTAGGTPSGAPSAVPDTAASPDPDTAASRDPDTAAAGDPDTAAAEADPAFPVVWVAGAVLLVGLGVVLVSRLRRRG